MTSASSCRHSRMNGSIRLCDSCDSARKGMKCFHLLDPPGRVERLAPVILAGRGVGPVADVLSVYYMRVMDAARSSRSVIFRSALPPLSLGSLSWSRLPGPLRADVSSTLASSWRQPKPKTSDRFLCSMYIASTMSVFQSAVYLLHQRKHDQLTQTRAAFFRALL